MRRKRRLDQALHDRAELLARSHPLKTVAAILKLQPSVLSEMKKRKWKALVEGAPKRPVPNDFAIQSAGMSFDQLKKHYTCSNNTLIRWFKEIPNPRQSWRGDTLRNVPRSGGPSKRKSEEELKIIRAKQWETRRAKYGPSGHKRGAYAQTTRRDDQ